MFLQNEEVCPKMHETIYKDQKNLHLNECLLKPKTSGLNKYYSSATLSKFNLSQSYIAEVNFPLQLYFSSSPKKNFNMGSPILT